MGSFQNQLWRLSPTPVICCISCYLLAIIHVVLGAGDIWPLDRPDGMPSIQSLEVMCGKDHMDVHLSFSHPFEGIVSSKGQHSDPRCVYVPPSSGQTFFSFRIAYTRCGTKPDLHGQFYENTVVVQYDKDLLEVWDEAKRLRCEWFNDYEKTASKPPMVIADLDVVQLDFRGDNVDCWMEIQHGKGPWAPPVSGIVPLGSTLTLVVAINDYRGEFDMRVKSCIASDGGGHVIQLSDEFGCVLRPKMISRFLKARGADERASVITYAFFHAFKFPDALSVHIKCKVEICRHGCLDHCQLQHGAGELDNGHFSGPIDRKDVSKETADFPDPVDNRDDASYDDIVQEGDEGAAIGGNLPPMKIPLRGDMPKPTQATNVYEVVENSDPVLNIAELPNKKPYSRHEQFPYGPRQFKQGEIPVPAPRSMSHDTDEETVTESIQSFTNKSRRKRNIVVADRKVRSADVGVSGLYEVISEADLAFSPDSRAEAVTVFQGRIREEVVYGICMPVPGFSILFVLVAVAAVVSALVAGTLLYRYQMQKEQIAQRAHHQNGTIAMSTFANWVGLRFKPKLERTSISEANGSADSNSATVSKTEDEQSPD
ncbi:hypothetical protein PPYR_06249 [Photinus pyralis]|uniref:ZP domain-containing protein n=4 Tax=Photinus pyralis TaxID=7054 RepID=A0A5N4AT63_PHOPY|nr:uncharacterized protein LOC116167495 [Photinus pyralis]XP_031338749.1 uncharacterized protein LOC116167495 [Photinus pyralis]KAB0800509.1 hypothetical protein PPYR_06249 [Photinus pyralis]